MPMIIKEIKRKIIDWDMTCLKIKMLRSDNINLRRFVCRTLYLLGDDRRICKHGAENCDTCIYEMDHSISQAELARL